MITVLLTDGEFTGMIKALRERTDVRIVGFCFSENAAHTAMLDKFYIAPSWNSPEYISFLIDVIEKERVDFIFPVVTKSLSLLASKAQEIKDKTGAVVITSSYEAITSANNKAELFKTLKAVTSTSEYITVHDVAKTIGELKEKIKVPCVVKPVIGENKEGFAKVVTDDEFKKALLKGETQGLMCPSLLRDNDDSEFSEPRLIMPYLPGQEWDADLLIIDGKIISATIRRNLDMFGGLSSCTETSDDKRVLEACEKIVAVLGLEYLSCISFKEDGNGDLKLLEINPRAMGSIYVSAVGGNNLVTRLLSNLTSEDDDRTFRLTPSGIKTSLYYDIVVLNREGENR